MSRLISRHDPTREDRRLRPARISPARIAAVRLRRTALAIALGATALTTAGCDDVRRTLGIDKSPPDEFRVVSRAPLSLPPDFALRPPQPGAPRPQEQTQYNRARAAVIGNGAAPQATAGNNGGRANGPGTASPPGGTGTVSPGETALLSRAGAAQADPSIRDTVNRESGQPGPNDDTLVERLLFGNSNREPLVDPDRESQRLREAQATGRAPTDGDTPTIQRRRRGLLEGLF